MIRARIQDPRFTGKTFGQSRVLDPILNHNHSEIIRMIRVGVGSKIARARPLRNLGSWIRARITNDSEMIWMIRVPGPPINRTRLESVGIRTGAA